MNTSDLKFQYLEKQYENLIPLRKNTQKEHNTFLAINKETKKIVIKNMCLQISFQFTTK